MELPAQGEGWLLELAAGASYPVGTTRSLAVRLLVDPSDGSGVVAPAATWDLADNVSLVASGYAGWGRTPELLTLRSQLGATPYTFLVQLRVDDQRSQSRARVLTAGARD